MTEENIKRMALEAGFSDGEVDYIQSIIIHFAKLVAQHERERIKQANAPEIERVNAHIKELEDAVKAEREACAKQLDALGCDHCATAIRERGQA